KDKIIKYNNIDIKIYKYDKVITANFIEHADEKYNLECKISDDSKVVTLFYKNNKIARMNELRPSSTTDIAYRLCKNKFKLEKYLQLMKLNTLSSSHFKESDDKDALKFIK